MEVICIEGAVPGSICATIAHRGDVRQVPMTVLRHPSGGWQVKQGDGGWGPRCHAVRTAVLMEASEVFAEARVALAAE